MPQTIVPIPSNQPSFTHIFAFNHEHSIAVSDKIAVFFCFPDIHEFKITRIRIFVFGVFLNNEVKLYIFLIFAKFREKIKITSFSEKLIQTMSQISRYPFFSSK